MTCTRANSFEWSNYEHEVNRCTNSLNRDLTLCSDYLLDFSGAQRGQYITDFFQESLAVTMSCQSHQDHNDGRCRIFDSSVPLGYWSDEDATRVGGTASQCPGATTEDTCGDPDLGSPNNQCTPGKLCFFVLLRFCSILAKAKRS